MNPSESPLPPAYVPTLTIERDERPPSPAASARRSLPVFAWVLLCAIVAIAVAAALYWQTRAPAPPEPVATPAPAAAPPQVPAVRYPIEDVPAHAGLATDAAAPLPPLASSDAALLDALAHVPGAGLIGRWLDPQDVARRVVATVDNLPRTSLPTQIRALRPVDGAFAVAAGGAPLSIAPDNAARYAPYVRTLESIDTKTLVAVYVRFYPLLEQAYRELGYPAGHFNDRVVDVIDLLLATPSALEPVPLVQPEVLYQFANPALEALPIGQRIIVRMGSANAARAKAKLTELRRALTGALPPA